MLQLSRKLRTSSQEVGTSLISLIRTTGQVQADPFDEVLRSRALPDCEKYFQEKIALLLSHLQIGLKGTVLRGKPNTIPTRNRIRIVSTGYGYRYIHIYCTNALLYHKFTILFESVQ